MRIILELAALLLVGVTFSLAFAHVLEWPGKLRLTRDQYLAVQKIYYPGFTYAGMCEPLSAIAILALVLTAPAESATGLLIAAFAAAAATHLLYWLLTAPANKVWLAEAQLSSPSRRFFGRGEAADETTWRSLRNRWERSHAARCVTAGAAFILLSIELVRR